MSAVPDLPTLAALAADETPFRLALSVALLALSLASTKLLQRWFSRSHSHLAVATRRSALAASRQILWTATLLLVASLWLAELRHVALSLAAIATGLLLAGRELVMAVLGRLLHASTRPFSIGDVVEIGPHAGQVVDVGLFTTTLLETDAMRQYSGHTVEVPNAQLLTAPLRNLSHTGRYVIESLRIPVPADAGAAAACARLEACLERACAGHLEAASGYLAGVEAEQVLSLPDFRPRVLVEPRDAHEIDLIARFPVPAARRAFVAQAVLRAFYVGEGEGAPDAPLPSARETKRPPEAAVPDRREDRGPRRLGAAAR